MKEDRRADRRKQIEAAAYTVLLERGFAGASMLEVAKKAKASNETLYRWYGDKNGLFATMVERNAAAGLDRLDQAMTGDAPLSERLTRFGIALLNGILSDSAIELNRAAAADTTGELGKTIALHGRDMVIPRLAQLLGSSGRLGSFEDRMDAAETFIALLVGDLQARRIIGTFPKPDEAYVQSRTKTAVARFFMLAAS